MQFKFYFLICFCENENLNCQRIFIDLCILLIILCSCTSVINTLKNIDHSRNFYSLFFMIGFILDLLKKIYTYIKIIFSDLMSQVNVVLNITNYWLREWISG